MDMVEKAVCKSFDLIYDDVYLDYARIYTRSNENLPALFSNFSVKDKDVLTVLASSNQYFSAYYLGAKSVDTFDVNYLAEFYWYLRYWLIEYKNTYFFDKEEIKRSNCWLRNSLNCVTCRSEGESRAYRYWRKTVTLTPDILGDYLFYAVRDFHKPVV